jgi:hypothetical protein
MKTMNTTQTIGQRWESYRPTKGLAVWACIASVVGALVVGFTWGGWVTGGSARSMAAKAATAANDQLVASICVDRFQAANDAPAQLVALKALGSYERGSFIEKGGWTTILPDQPMATRTAARLCADQLAAL